MSHPLPPVDSQSFAMVPLSTKGSSPVISAEERVSVSRKGRIHFAARESARTAAKEFNFEENFPKPYCDGPRAMVIPGRYLLTIDRCDVASRGEGYPGNR